MLPKQHMAKCYGPQVDWAVGDLRADPAEEGFRSLFLLLVKGRG